MLGGKEDWDKSIHEPIEMTLGEVTEIANTLVKDKVGLTIWMYELFVVFIALRQWAEARECLKMISDLEGWFILPSPPK